MSNNTQYQPVPTTTTSRETCRSRSGLRSLSVTLVLLSIVVGIPLIIFYGLVYNKKDNFSTEPSYCRINAIGEVRETSLWGTGGGYKWNADILKQPPGNNASKLKDPIVLRPNVTTLAHKKAELQYSVGEIYPCYVHKKLLSSNANDNVKINLKYAFTWEKPSKTSIIIWLSIGSASIIIAIISVLFAIVSN